MRRWLGPSLAALALAAGACWLAWPAPAFHCGCASVQCELPCVDCCTGATPSGCPLPSGAGLLPDPEPDLVLPERAR